MRSLKTIFSILLLLLATLSYGQKRSKSNCSILQSGKFKYLDAQDTTAYIIMSDGIQTDFNGVNDNIIISKIKWTGDCSYTMTMTKVTIPDFPYKPGDTMKVIITKVEGNVIYYTTTINGNSWTGRFKKID